MCRFHITKTTLSEPHTPRDCGPGPRPAARPSPATQAPAPPAPVLQPLRVSPSLRTPTWHVTCRRFQAPVSSPRRHRIFHCVWAPGPSRRQQSPTSASHPDLICTLCRNLTLDTCACVSRCTSSTELRGLPLKACSASPVMATPPSSAQAPSAKLSLFSPTHTQLIHKLRPELHPASDS